MALPLGTAIQEAVRLGGYTAKNVPTVAAHMVGGGSKLTVAMLAPEKVVFNPQLMKQVESYLEHSGVPMGQGLKVLKAEAAADSLVLVPAVQIPGKEIAVKLTRRKGIYERDPRIKEDLLFDAVQQNFHSVQNPGETFLVRIEPMVLPLDKALAHLPAESRGAIEGEFDKLMRERARGKGLADVDVKTNNFAIPKDQAPVKDLPDLLSRDPRLLDIDAVRIPPQSSYVPVLHETPPYHIDQLFDLPTLEKATGTPATKQIGRGQSPS